MTNASHIHHRAPCGTATRRTTCLNGWWDFLPLAEPHPPVAPPPRTGWLKKACLVPSWWNKPLNAIRKKGAREYVSAQDETGTLSDVEHYECLFDAYGYPAAWTNAKAGWLRRTVHVEALPPGRRLILIIEAAAPQCVVFFNGQYAGRNTDAMLPLTVDVTGMAHAGDNELAVLILDYERDARGRTLTPSGNFLTANIRGIWQNVWLVERSELYVSDVIIRTSTRSKTLAACVTVANDAHAVRMVTCAAVVTPWRKGRAPFGTRAVLALGRRTLAVPPCSTATVVFEACWPRAQWWAPEHPALYWLRTRLDAMGHECDLHAERFGFREVWLDGPHLMLNDHPVHLFSDWGHKVTPFHHTEAWIRQWFGMLRDAHMNHTRLHTHPHLPLTLDIADEEGILITGETGIHGSGANQAADTPAFWDHARDHIRRFVQRDKNHPSLILWSVENEMRWNRDTTTLAREELPKLRALFNELDPTRPAYHEGDSSLWDERTQPLISRHYNKECSGLGWWQRTQPLHSGEMALYHYAGPNNTCHLAGDEAWADYRAVSRAAATDAALIIEAGRTLGVCCFGPWNLSCLENLRMDARTHRLAYPDYTEPGVTPLLVKPHSSEFEFWKRGKGYTPFVSFAIQAHAFRPLAVIDRSQRAQYMAGARMTRELCVVNDTPADVRGTLKAVLLRGTRVVAQKAWQMRVARGHVAAREGARVIINNASGPTLAALSTALDIPLRVKDVGPVYQLVRAARDPVLNGVSNEDTCGIERFSYCSNEAVNTIVATRCIAPVKQLEPLLKPATHSCLRELFVGDGKTEPLRAHTISRYLFRERPAAAVGLGRVRCGAGAVYLNQFAPPVERCARLHTLAARLAANLGAPRADSVLDAGPRAAPATRSAGAPRSIWVLQDTCTDALRDTLLRAAQFSGERLAPSGVLTLATWREQACEAGLPAAACGPARPVWLYYRLESPVPRKNLKLDIDVPNPAALTFLEASGGGTFELFVNGRTHASHSGDGSARVFPDIELERGWNQILLAWTPASGAAILRMHWCTISGQPEVSFDFC